MQQQRCGAAIEAARIARWRTIIYKPEQRGILDRMYGLLVDDKHPAPAILKIISIQNECSGVEETERLRRGWAGIRGLNLYNYCIVVFTTDGRPLFYVEQTC